MDLEQFHNEAAEALGSADEYYTRQFIEKWIPIVTNEITALRQREQFLELELTEAQGALEEG